MPAGLTADFNTAVFISIGVTPMEQNAGFPDLDKVITRSNLRSLADYCQRGDIRLVMRDDDAIIPMMKVMCEDRPGQLVVVPASTDADTIVANEKIAAAFFMAGTNDVLKDFSALQGKDLVKIPLPGTGGAAEMIRGMMEVAGNLPEAVTSNPRDIYGMNIIAQSIAALNRN